MKRLIILSVFCFILYGTSYSISPSEIKKETLFKEIKTLRLQVRVDEYYLNSIQNFGEANKYRDIRDNLSKTKEKIENLDKEYTTLLSANELKEYSNWKNIQNNEDKRQDLGWWYITYTRRGGC